MIDHDPREEDAGHEDGLQAEREDAAKRMVDRLNMKFVHRIDAVPEVGATIEFLDFELDSHRAIVEKAWDGVYHGVGDDVRFRLIAPGVSCHNQLIIPSQAMQSWKYVAPRDVKEVDYTNWVRLLERGGVYSENLCKLVQDHIDALVKLPPETFGRDAAIVAHSAYLVELIAKDSR